MPFSSRAFTMATAASSSVAFAAAAPDAAQECARPSATHLIVLVHGWMGNAQEMEYMKKSLEREATKHPSQKFVVVSPVVNEGRTHDGIAAGGERLAEEVSRLVAQHQDDGENSMTTLSFVGNSLGGLYSRFALSKLDFGEQNVTPMVFATTATPHLGVSRHTYVPLPKWGEYLVAYVLRPTGRDLFNVSPIVEELAFEPKYTVPLQQFQQRIAYANAFCTDFQVPTCTAAFLCPDSPHVHTTVASKSGETTSNDDNDESDKHFVLRVETQHDPTITATQSARTMGHALDSMGWKKVFCDMRDKIPLPSMPLPSYFSTADPEIPKRASFSTTELIPLVTSLGTRWNVPMGHQVLVANSKHGWYTQMSAGGRPVVDKMALDLVNDIVELTNKLQEEKEVTV